MNDFLELVKGVGPTVAICVAVMFAGWKFLQQQADRQDAREAADRAERQRAWDIHAASVKTMTDAHGVAMKDVASSVATMAQAVTGVTEAVRNCRQNGR